jgi:hypothetical protein
MIGFFGGSWSTMATGGEGLKQVETADPTLHHSHCREFL